MTFPAAITAIVALVIAFKAYPWQKELDRKHKVDEEKRKVISQLILALEEYMGILTRASLVKYQTVPDTDAARLEVHKALSLVRVYGSEPVVNAAVTYERSISMYGGKLEKVKAEREKCPPHPNREDWVQSTDAYRGAVNDKDAAYRSMKDERNVFFDALNVELNIKVPKTQISEQPEEKDP